MQSRKTKQLSDSKFRSLPSMVQSGADVAGFARQRPKLDGSRAALTTRSLVIAPLSLHGIYCSWPWLIVLFSSQPTSLWKIEGAAEPKVILSKAEPWSLPTQLRD